MPPRRIIRIAPFTFERFLARVIISSRCLLLAVVLISLSGCGQSQSPTPAPAGDAKVEFEKIANDFHAAAAEAEGAEKTRLLKLAEEGYSRFLKMHPADQIWAAQAMRNLGSVKALQGNTDQALALYQGLEKKYPRQHWEIAQAWKSAGDLLWESNRHAEASIYYSKIVASYSSTNQPQVIALMVRSAKKRLEDKS